MAARSTATTGRSLIQVEKASDIDESGGQRLAAELTRIIRSNLVFNPVIEIVEAGALEPPGAGKVRLAERIV